MHNFMQLYFLYLKWLLGGFKVPRKSSNVKTPSCISRISNAVIVSCKQLHQFPSDSDLKGPKLQGICSESGSGSGRLCKHVDPEDQANLSADTDPS